MKLSVGALRMIGQIFDSATQLTLPSANARAVVEIQDWVKVELANQSALEASPEKSE